MLDKKSKLDRKHVSDVDTFLQGLDAAQSEKSASQQAEMDKHARIAQLRDDAAAMPDADDLFK